MLASGILIVWIVGIVLFVIVEILTQGLTSIWFAVGALGGCIAALLGAAALLQIGIFIAVTIVALILTNPLKKKFLDKKVQPTNIDAVVGKIGVAEETIGEKASSLPGRVRCENKSWAANSEEGEIPAGTTVVVTEVRGVTLIVRPAEDAEKGE